MKLLSIVSLVALAVVAASGSLQDDFNEFAALLPVNEIVEIARRYIRFNKDVQLAVAYISGPEFAVVWDQVFAQRELRGILDYLQDAGVDAYGFFNRTADLIGLSPVGQPQLMLEAAGYVQGRGLKYLIDEVLAVLPTAKFVFLLNKKLDTSAEFMAFFQKVASIDFQKLVEFYNNSAELQSLFNKLREQGVDVDMFFEFVKQTFGWDS